MKFFFFSAIRKSKRSPFVSDVFDAGSKVASSGFDFATGIAKTAVNPFELFSGRRKRSPKGINSRCRNLYMKGFPFYGKESVTLSEMLRNQRRTGLGANHRAHQRILFQQEDKNRNGRLEVEEKIYDDYSKVQNGANLKDFQLADKDKNGLLSISELEKSMHIKHFSLILM